MKKEYQKLNPSNARIEIDYENDDVKIEYVHNKTPFQICFFTFLKPVTITNIIIFFLVSIIIGYIDNDKSLVRLQFGFIFLILILLIPMIFAFLFSKNKKLLKLMPNINYLLTFRKPTFASFFPKDVINNKCEIPLFANVGLDYEAQGDFSKKLIKVKINEHGFNNLIKGRKKLNPYLWKATFFFSEAPKNGKLEVKFK